MVDLESAKQVDAVRLYNRADFGERLDGFEIRVGDSLTFEDNTACFTGGTAPLDPPSVEVRCKATGRYVFVEVY